jgi:AcrR family transcriptional regulator
MKETGQKIIEAAMRVIARDGVGGATTREIARTARVNEVTLFRYFKNKNELLRRVVLSCSERFEHIFAEARFETRTDLRRTVMAYAKIYVAVLHDNEDFVRTFMGELNRHPKLCRSLFVESSKPARQKFIAYLQAAQKQRLVRRNLDVTTAADALTGMLLSGMIRRPLTGTVYRHEDYVATCLELFLKGIEP